MEPLLLRLARNAAELQFELARVEGVFCLYDLGATEGALGPMYWIPRCHGFGVICESGDCGVVERVVTDGEGAAIGLSVEFLDWRELIEPARIVDLDPVQRQVWIAAHGDEKSSPLRKGGNDVADN